MPCPTLSEVQREALREFIIRHRDETDGRISVNPILLARVLAGDKPAADIDLKGERTHPDFDDPDGYLLSLCRTLDLHAKQINGFRSWTIGRSSWRLALLPTTVSETDAFHRRCGYVYGYPADAIEDFVSTTTRITNCDLVRAGIFSAADAAYLTFVPFTYHNSVTKIERLIENGKNIRDRIGQLAVLWDLPRLDEYAELLHNDTRRAYQGRGTYRVPTTFPPDQDVTKHDIEPLLSNS